MHTYVLITEEEKVWCLLKLGWDLCVFIMTRMNAVGKVEFGCFIALQIKRVGEEANMRDLVVT